MLHLYHKTWVHFGVSNSNLTSQGSSWLSSLPPMDSFNLASLFLNVFTYLICPLVFKQSSIAAPFQHAWDNAFLTLPRSKQCQARWSRCPRICLFAWALTSCCRQPRRHPLSPAWTTQSALATPHTGQTPPLVAWDLIPRVEPLPPPVSVT